MTRTDLPDILVSTVHRDIKVIPISSHYKSLQPSKQCDFINHCTLEDSKIKVSKRHCRTFDNTLLEYPESCGYLMESPYRKADRQAVNPDVAWSASGRQQRYRFSAPDIFSHRLTPQSVVTDMASEIVVPEHKRRTRSKSAPRVQTSLTPVSLEGSSSSRRKGRESQRASRDSRWRTEASPRRESSYAATRAQMHEVHPIKLQPQIGDSSRYSPHYASDKIEDGSLDKPATSPHVRCRVDIMPDDAALHHSGRKQTSAHIDIPWQRQHSAGSKSLTVPRHFSYSRTPTPTDSLGTESRQAYQYSRSMPNSYLQQAELPLQRMASSGDYYGRERRAHSSPNVPTKFFYADEPGRYVTTAPPQPSYFHDEPYTPGQAYTPKVQYVQDPRTRMVHAVATRPYYPEMEPYPYSVQTGYPKPYAANEPGPYIIRTPPTRIVYADDPRSYQIQTAPPRFNYASDMYMPPEHHVPARAYYTEGRRHARVIQPPADDWYGSDASGYSTNPASYVSQVTPTRVRQDPVLAPWYANPCVEPQKIGTDSKSYSRSWDNILNSRVEREQPLSVQRGQSYDDLLDSRKPSTALDDKPQPVVVNLSSSPRRYAALSMSDNSLIDKSPTETSKSSSKLWFVTPEITITDNDIRPGNLIKSEGRSASWDILDSRSTEGPEVFRRDYESSTKEKTHDNASLQQSLEQLDELLADLVTDYKPPSRRASEDILDQLKKLIDEEEKVSLSRKSSKTGTEEPPPLDKQPTSIKINPDAFCDMDGASDAMKSAEECSPDQSPDEDDTMMCSNNRCRRTETLFNACLYFKSCHSCYTYYCSRNCRREDWDIHKESCLYGRIGSTCRHIIKHCRETVEVHKAFSRIAKVGYLSRGRGVLFLGFPNPSSSSNFLQYGLDSLVMSPTYLSLRELESFKDNLGEYCKELQEAGKEYDPNECFILNVSIAVGEQLPDGPSPRNQAPTVRKYAKVALASFSPERKVHKKESDMETLILTPPPGTADIDKEGEEGRKAREICFINIQRELRIRGVFLRHEYPLVYQQLCEFVENNRRFTPTTIYPVDKRTGKQFMCMIMAASEPRTLDWVGTPHLLDDII
ncbi:apical junction component 1 homolog [Cololabis saira]|uniref:apical junction component 1 homolog n=1 Tax=Cololabis saira TaxID=129043 RepID=UPI002AD45E8B|nr:apical junction component 1 homolog [Cololabis saira]XP_061590513.1 apical junction component 1 homolog [Cololabis saira]